jgi:hypothetical protein
MLRRNHLITAEDVKRLERWIDRVEWVTLRILGGATDIDAVFAETD